MHRPDEALKALEKGSKCTRSSYQIFTVQKAYILYYLETKEYEKARKTLVELEQLFEKDKSLTLYKSGLFYIQIEYYRNTGQYRKALDVIEEHRMIHRALTNTWTIHSPRNKATSIGKEPEGPGCPIFTGIISWQQTPSEARKYKTQPTSSIPLWK